MLRFQAHSSSKQISTLAYPGGVLRVLERPPQVPVNCLVFTYWLGMCGQKRLTHNIEHILGTVEKIDA